MNTNINNMTKAELTEMLWSYRDELARYLSVFDISRDQVEDALQDTMFAAWKNIDQLRDINSMKSWLFAIARNIGIKYVKMNNKDKMHNVCFESLMDRFRDANVLCDPYIYDQFTNTRKDVIVEVLGYLSLKEAKVVILHYIYGHKLNEIALMIGESYDNTKQISSRAIKKLRKHFKEAENEQY
ncbi:MAG: sigma-70 family RNA polymerase sigma factor [Firmicutes bacterium]|nr:sigma-70 family RNA polymerase sigma factor [Bacillota bacterium]